MSTQPARRLDGMLIQFAPVSIPAFKGGQGYWANYEALAAAGINSVEVTPKITTTPLNRSRDFINIDCHFDIEALPPQKFGLVYGDDQFEESINDYICGSLGLDMATGSDLQVIFTEAGMQSEGIISMEPRPALREYLRDISNHQLIALSRKPQFDIVNLGDFSWSRES